MSSANITLVRSLYVAFQKGDIDTVLAGLDPAVDWAIVGRPEDHPAMGPRRGVQAVGDFFRTIAEEQDFEEFEPEAFYGDEDKVFVLGRYRMRSKRTGRMAESPWVHVFTVQDGKVLQFREFVDTATVADAFRD